MDKRGGVQELDQRSRIVCRVGHAPAHFSGEITEHGTDLFAFSPDNIIRDLIQQRHIAFHALLETNFKLIHFFGNGGFYFIDLAQAALSFLFSIPDLFLLASWPQAASMSL